MSKRATFGGTTTGIALRSGGGNDGTVVHPKLDVNVSPDRMLLVTGIVLLWFLYVWATR